MFLFKINYSCATHNENICEVFVRETSNMYVDGRFNYATFHIFD